MPNPEASHLAYAKALNLALRECDSGKAEGCAAAGYMYQDGKGAESDAVRGDELVRKACQMGYSWACKPRSQK